MLAFPRRFNNFLDAIDASYCTYDGGDNPTYDAVYPDPYPGPGSYKGQEDCGTYAAAKVISTSYSYSEIELPPAYEIRQCYEYMKLSLTGTTFVYSSGDYGVEADGGGYIAADGSFNDGNSGEFVASFPSGCPYVLSAGATQIRNGTYNVDAAIKAGEEVEVVMEDYLFDGAIDYDFTLGADPIGQVIFSSTGGFSNVFEVPSYQESTVNAYLKNYAPDYPGSPYNNSGKARAFPDMSSNGAWLSIAVDGELSQVFGTSCSAPTIAALLSLINGERLNAGKSTIGFANPVLYAHPEMFHDVRILTKEHFS